MPSACVRLHDDACELCHLGERSVWHGLDSRARNLLAGKLTRREYGSGEVVIAQGEANDGVYCISSGTVAMRRLDGAGNSVLLCFGYPGDVIGYQAFLAGRPHQNSAEALGPTVTCRIGRATLTALLEAIPALGLRFLKRSIGEAEQAYDAIFRQSVLSNRHRLVHLLLAMVRRVGRSDGHDSREFELPVSRRDLASMIGARHETVSRIMSRLESDGVAYFSGRCVSIPSLDRLAAELHAHAADR
jgi:CRP/FNR family transcriptional regulator